MIQMQSMVDVADNTGAKKAMMIRVLNASNRRYAYLGDRVVATAPSGSGFQLSVAGLLGLTVSGIEGVEVNLLGLSFGINPFDPAFKLPLAGRLGPARHTKGAPHVTSAGDRPSSKRTMR